MLVSRSRGFVDVMVDRRALACFEVCVNVLEVGSIESSKTRAGTCTGAAVTAVVVGVAIIWPWTMDHGCSVVATAAAVVVVAIPVAVIIVDQKTIFAIGVNSGQLLTADLRIHDYFKRTSIPHVLHIPTRGSSDGLHAHISS